MLHYRLGLDMGTNSLGWCAVQMREDGSTVGILDLGVRIFDDGREPAKKDIPGESSAVQRRTARGMRRRYDRKLMRKKATLRALTQAGLMPESPAERKKLEALEPLKLRTDALTHKLEAHAIGRALFHLQQRRGFKSNRKDAQKEGDNNIDGMKLGMRDLSDALGARTLGQFLYEEFQKDGNRQSTRFHARMEGSRAKYDYYPTRAMIEEEFNAIWEAQRKHHPELLTDDAKQAIHTAIFYQRPLKPQPKGRCSILPTEERMAWAMPTAQHFRIAKEIANLRIQRTDDYSYKGEELENRQKLTEEQRTKLFNALCHQGSMTFRQMKGKKVLDLDSSVTFNLEVPPRKGLDGDKTAIVMRREECFGNAWDDLTLEEQDMVIEKLICDDPKDPDYLEDEPLAVWLTENYGLTSEQTGKIMDASLPASHAKFGKTVITETLPQMRDKGLMEYDALKACGRNPGDQYTGEVFEKLPYYGELLEGHVVRNQKSSDPMVREYGRVSNPTVHIALNQLRRLMNTLKDRYGCWPKEIVVEMTRDLKKGRKEITDIIKGIEKNTKNRDTYRKEIADHLGISEESVSNSDIDKMKLWYELEGDATHRKCVFSGEMINLTRLFQDVEIEHILPRSQTLDNTSANKTLATREANRLKGNKTPYEAFKNRTGQYSYDAIWERAQALPKSKQWRFHQDAMKIFEEKAKKILLKSSLGTEEIDTELEAFAARQLNDTSYIAKLAKKYLAYACDKGKNGVRVTPGTLTGLLRRAWGLNTLLGNDEEKNRNDHRHHAIDALVIALTDIRTIQQVQYASAREEEERAKGNNAISVKKILGNEKPAIFSDWDALKEAVDQIIVSYKPDHGSPRHTKSGTTGLWDTSGRLHEDTYYGYAGDGTKKGTVALVVRVPLTSLKKESDLADIRDAALRETLQQFVFDYDGSLEQALIEFSNSKGHVWAGIQKIRILKEKSADSMIPVKRHKDGTPWKMAQGGSNQRAEIYCLKSGKNAGKWQMEVIKSFDANQKGFLPVWRTEHPNAKLVMALHKGDMVAYEDDGKIQVCRVKKMLSNGRTYFLPHTIVKDDGDKYSKDFSSAEAMQKANLRRIYVKADGSVYDPYNELTTPHILPEAVA